MAANTATHLAPDPALLRRYLRLDWLSPGFAALLILVLVLWQLGPAVFGSAWPTTWTMTGATRKILFFAFMWVAVSSSWNLVGGYTGYIDFGHTAFFGLGGYTAGILMAHLAQWPFWAAAIAAVVVASVFAVLIGWPTLRLRGAYFAIAMLGTFVATREVVLNLKALTNGGEAISFRPPFMRDDAAYYTFLALAGGVFFLSLLIYRSQLGRALRAIRDDEISVDMRGINTTRLKISIFALAAGITGLIGATRAYQNAYIEVPIIFQLDMIVQIIVIALLGGIGRPWGPVLGTAIYETAQRTIWARFPELHLIITGLLLVAIVLFIPRGVLGLLDPEGRGLAWRFALWQTRRQLRASESSSEQPAVP
jgi:branched-chain amino acid transport system permease protein